MPTLTSRLGLKRPEGDDPFLRQDFVDNLNILDSYPGYFPCTSATRPSNWGASRKGMLIYETDTRRWLSWDAPGWIEVHQAPPMSTGGINPEQTLGRNAKATFTADTFTITRPGQLLVFGQVRIGIDAGRTQNCWIDAWINGSDASVASGSYHRQQDNGTGATGNNSYTIPILGSRQVNPGTYNIQARVGVGDYASAPVTVSAVHTTSIIGVS